MDQAVNDCLSVLRPHTFLTKKRLRERQPGAAPRQGGWGRVKNKQPRRFAGGQRQLCICPKRQHRRGGRQQIVQYRLREGLGGDLQKYVLLLGAARLVEAIRLAGFVGGKTCANAAAGLLSSAELACISMLAGTSLRRADKAYETLPLAQAIDGM